MKTLLKSLALIALTSALWVYVMHRELQRAKSECAKEISDIYMLTKPV